MSDAALVLGRRTLSGRLAIPGFKHALVPILACAPLVSEEVTIGNAPDIADVSVLCEILSGLGCECSLNDSILTVRGGQLSGSTVPEALSGQVHGSIYLIPTLLAATGRIELNGIGGCQIGDGPVGERPFHHVLDVMRRFGASFDVSRGRIVGRSSRFQATRIDIKEYSASGESGVSGPLVSGATKTSLLAASVADGTSIIENPYRKLDVNELIDFLRSANVPILDEGKRIFVEGQRSLQKTKFDLASDLMEVITFVGANVYLGADVVLELVQPQKVKDGLASEFDVLGAMGVEAHWNSNFLRVSRPTLLEGCDIVVRSDTIYSDSQPFFALMLTSARARSSIEDRVWRSRFAYAGELAKLGANIELGDGKIIVRPGRPLHSNKRVVATELRGAVALLLAALGIDGYTEVIGVRHIERGHQNFIARLNSLGASIELI